MITKNWVVPGEISEFVIEGTCDVDEVVNTINAKYCSISKGVLWNLSRGSISNFTTNDISRIAMAVKGHVVHNKTALFALADLNFGLFRMYETLAELENVTHVIKVFRNRDEAIQWLMAPIKENIIKTIITLN